MERFISLKETLPIRKIIAAGALGLTVGACGKSEITDGFVYKKEHADSLLILQPAGKDIFIPYLTTDRDVEAIGEQSVHKREGEDRKRLLDDLGMKIYPHFQTETWNVSIAQCPTPALRSVETVEKECTTRPLSVPKDIFQSAKLGQPFRLSKS